MGETDRNESKEQVSEFLSTICYVTVLFQGDLNA